MAQEKPNWDKLPPRDWGEEQAHRTALEVRRLRGKRTAQWLADRTEVLGYPLSRAVISDLEVGRRRYITTAELTVLAAALSTAPVNLVYPGPYGDEVRVLPNESVTELIAAQWFSGLLVDFDHGGTPLTNVLGEFDVEYSKNLDLLTRARAIQQLSADMKRLYMYADQNESSDPKLAERQRLDALSKQQEISRLTTEMDELFKAQRGNDGG